MAPRMASKDAGLASMTLVSVDDHVQEPPDLWTERLPAGLRAVAPVVKRERMDRTFAPSDDDDAAWGDVWHFEGKRYPVTRHAVAAGRDPSEVLAVPVTYDEMRPGCFQQAARLEDMDVNGVEASLCFPNTFTRFAGQRFSDAADRDLGLACLQAYNDWMIDAWASGSGGRLIPCCLVPLWSPTAAAEEIRRNAARGCRAVSWTEIPAWLGLPTFYGGEWEPFFAACAETGTVINLHVGSAPVPMTTSDDAPDSIIVANDYVRASLSLSDWLMSGVLASYPSLKIAFSEAQAGWMPYIVERLDSLWRGGNAFNEARSLDEPPSVYFRRQVYACIFDDPVSLELLDRVPAEHIMFETDYPHPDSTWPNTMATAGSALAGLPTETIEKILRTNAIELFGLS